jgi:hypothetical protein
VPFFREQSGRFLCENVIKIVFFAQRALLKTCIYVISGKCFHFREKYDISGKSFGISEKIFHI